MKETRYLISETAKLVQVEPHVLRYWEEELGLSIKQGTEKRGFAVKDNKRETSWEG